MPARPVNDRGVTTFSVWAPDASVVELDLSGDRRPMSARAGGWWELDVPAAGPGTDYAFRVEGSEPLPDPRSRWQPNGVDGPARVWDRAEGPRVPWQGRALAGSVLYELHIGTFTPKGTFAAAVDHLDHLVELGVDLVELMPVAAFPGRSGWGYDGVHLWAVHEPYGGPVGLARFVDACHERGLGVVLDVVYNHLGPSGNRLPSFGPYFTDRHHTPWGAAVNLDDAGSDEVRRWIVENALMWLGEFGIDGLRLDAVHALVDERAVHVLEELSADVDALAAATGRPLFLVAESDLNDPRVVTPREAGGLGVHAQWSDDLHHALHTLLTGERQGYYADFGSAATVATVLTSAFFHADTWSSFRGRRHGRPVDRARTEGWRFVAYLQDHDQIGNRATGDRIGATIGPDLLAVGAALVLTSPFTPMLFMGEEWGASTPWQYFTDHQEPELAEAVRTGRRAEFAGHGWEADDIPDPQDPATVRASTLRWDELSASPHDRLLRWHRDLIALRHRVPDLADPRLDRVRVRHDGTDDAPAHWLAVTRGRHLVVVNLSDAPVEVPLGAPGAEVVLAWSPVKVDGGAVRLAAANAVVLHLQGS